MAKHAWGAHGALTVRAPPPGSGLNLPAPCLLPSCSPGCIARGDPKYCKKKKAVGSSAHRPKATKELSSARGSQKTAEELLKASAAGPTQAAGLQRGQPASVLPESKAAIALAGPGDRPSAGHTAWPIVPSRLCKVCKQGATQPSATVAPTG